MGSPEAKPRIIQPFKRAAELITKRRNKESPPSWLQNPLLSEIVRENLKAYGGHLEEQGKKEVDRVKNDIKIATHIELNGKMVTFLEYFHEKLALREKEKQEALARGEKMEPFHFPQKVYTEPLTNEQRRERDFRIVHSLHTELAKEAYNTQFDLIAQSIQKDIWKDTNPLKPVSSITPTGHIEIEVKKDGTVKNRSYAGTTISYENNIVSEKHRKYDVHKYNINEISIGIGYFGERTEIIPEAQGSVTDEELEKGVKSLYIQRTYTERGKIIKKKTEISVIPLTYNDHMDQFANRLYDTVEKLTPEQVLPQSSRRN